MSRKIRALALGAVAVVAMALAGVAYLHPNLPRIQMGSPPVTPPASELSASQHDDLGYAFVTPSVGWAVDVRSDVANLGGDLWIFRTTDGARHWQQQLRAKVIGPGYTGIHFVDATHGFVSVGSPLELFRTQDGSHWNRIDTPGDEAVEIAFFDPMHGWLLNSLGPHAGQELYATRDGGDMWSQLPTPPPDAFGLVVRDDHEVWMGGLQGDTPHVYLSTDGGRSWEPRGLPFSADASTRPGPCSTEVQLLPASGIFASGGCGKLARWQTGFTTFDDGGRWHSVSMPADVSSVTFVDPFHWWAMMGGALWKSADAGATWEQVRGYDPDGWEYLPQALDATHAWAQVFNPQVTQLWGLALTSDGGVHWTRVNVPHP